MPTVKKSLSHQSHHVHTHVHITIGHVPCSVLRRRHLEYLNLRHLKSPPTIRPISRPSVKPPAVSPRVATNLLQTSTDIRGFPTSPERTLTATLKLKTTPELTSTVSPDLPNLPVETLPVSTPLERFQERGADDTGNLNRSPAKMSSW